jgi:hypothetical protein
MPWYLEGHTILSSNWEAWNPCSLGQRAESYATRLNPAVAKRLHGSAVSSPAGFQSVHFGFDICICGQKQEILINTSKRAVFSARVGLVKVRSYSEREQLFL